jgi:glycosyltransferase involved in cell wall biosynthesis
MNSASPLKIFHVNMHRRWGGQPNRILTEARVLAELGQEVWVAGPRGCMLCQRAKAAGIRVFDDLELARGFRPRSQLRDLRRLRDLFERERFDVIHPHGSQDTWLSVIAARGLSPRPALVRTRHNTFPIATHSANRWLHRRLDWVITIAPQVDELVTARGMYPAERVTAIYSAPDLNRFTPREASNELRRELGLPEGAPVIGMVARLAPEKGHDLFLGAAAEVARDFPVARFMLVGEGRSKPEIEARIAELGLGDRVILCGFRSDVPELVALMDVFALTPTAGESLGTSILEALAMEKPVVATQVGGTGESVRDGATGFLVRPGSKAEQTLAIAEALKRLLADPDLRRRMGQAGRRMVIEEFSPRALGERSLEIYRRLVASRPSAEASIGAGRLG